MFTMTMGEEGKTISKIRTTKKMCLKVQIC